MAMVERLGRGRAVFLLLSLAVLLPIAAGTITRAVAQSGFDEDDSLYKHLSVFTEVLSLIQRSYVDETSIERLFAGALDGTTDALDPLATFVPASGIESFRTAREIGTGHSGVSVGRDAGISFVIAVEPGSPGSRAGLEPGDIVAEIDGRSTREMALWELQVLLAGTAEVDIEVLRRGESQEMELRLGSFTRSAPTLGTDRGVPVLTISHFSPETPGEIESLLDEAEVATSERLIIDVRGVAGGSAEMAYQVASLFAEGRLGELKSRGETTEIFENDGESRWRGRLALLADGACQGASEILLAVLKNLPGAEIVGRRTFGHAGRQTEQSLPSGATLFFSDAFYTGPDGEILEQGVEPEVKVSESRLSLRGTEDTPGDAILERALELLLTEPEERRAA